MADRRSQTLWPTRQLLRLLPQAQRERWFEPALNDLLADSLWRQKKRWIFQLRVLACACSCLLWAAFDAALRPSPATPIDREPFYRKESTMHAFAQDLRYAWRSLGRRKSFSLVSVIILTLGIGAATAIFSVVQAVLLNPVPFRQPDRLYALQLLDEREHRQHNQLAYLDYVDLRRENRSFEDMAAVLRWASTLEGEPPQRVEGILTTASLFSVLGVEAQLGRTFLPEEERPGGPAVALISHALWSSRFGSDPATVGSHVKLDGEQYTVVGILPPAFRLELPQSGNDFWLPLRPNHFLTGSRAITSFETFARLKEGVTEEAARAELQTLGRQLAEVYPETNQGRGIGLMPLAEQVSGPVRPALLTLMAASGMLLLLASVNLANLFLSRGASRHREIALRGALGAGRGRIAVMLLSESLILALAGGLGGILLAAATVRYVPALLPSDFPRWEAIGLDPVMLAFALSLGLATGLVFGLLPAWTGARVEPADALRHSGAGPVLQRLRSGLVVAQVGLALALLIGAGLLAGSLSALMSLDPGFRTENVLTFRLALPPESYGSRAKIAAYARELRQRLESLPEVRQAAAVSSLPLTGHNVGSSLNIEGRPLPLSEAPAVGWQFVSPGYFEAMGIPLLQGRDFVDADLPGEHLVIINHALASKHFPAEDPIGKRIELGLPSGDWHRIIGIVGDVRHRSLDGEPDARAYDLLGQHAEFTLTAVVHSAVAASSAIDPIRRAVQELDSHVPLFALATTAEVRSRSVATRRLAALLMGAFASMALVLAAVGIFGVLSYMVQRRTREIGVRMAVGARALDILRLVVGKGLLLTLTGALLGLLASLGLSRLLASMLYGVSPTDPSTILLMALLLTTVALLSCLIPARRASRIDPQSALRTE